MKKIISLALIVLFAVACGKKEEDFYLTYNNKDIKLNSVFNVDVHGNYNSLFESENCAFGDRDVTYIYDDIEIETYGNEKNDLIIYSIILTGENVETNEKVSLYDSYDDMVKAYGNSFTKNDNKYVYTHGNTSLIFIVQDEIIESIEYRLNNLDK